MSTVLQLSVSGMKHVSNLQLKYRDDNRFESIDTNTPFAPLWTMTSNISIMLQMFNPHQSNVHSYKSSTLNKYDLKYNSNNQRSETKPERNRNSTNGNGIETKEENQDGAVLNIDVYFHAKQNCHFVRYMTTNNHFTNVLACEKSARIPKDTGCVFLSDQVWLV